MTKSAKMDEIQKYMTIWNYSYENDLFVANTRGLGEAWRTTRTSCCRSALRKSCEWGRDRLEAEEDALIQGFY